MSSLITVLCLSTAQLTSRPAFAQVSGASSGGGGKGVVCRNKNGSIKSVELLDLWEAREIFHRKVPASKGPIDKRKVDALVAAAVENLRNAIPWHGSYDDGHGGNLFDQDAFVQLIKNQVSHFESDVTHLHGKRITPTQDSYEDFGPKDCAIEQLVLYKDHGTPSGRDGVFMDDDLVSYMDSTNYAALKVHEALYRYLRGYNEKTSLRVRRAVGYVMGGQTFRPLESDLSDPRIDCVGDFDDSMQSNDGPINDTLVHIVQRPDGVVIVPETIGGSPIFSFDHSVSSNEGGTLDSFLENSKNLSEGRGGGYTAGKIHLSGSQIDFDLTMLFGTTSTGQVKVKVLHSPSGITTQTIDLRCSKVSAPKPDPSYPGARRSTTTRSEGAQGVE